jgi:hypothetical protein
MLSAEVLASLAGNTVQLGFSSLLSMKVTASFKYFLITL